MAFCPDTIHFPGLGAADEILPLHLGEPEEGGGGRGSLYCYWEMGGKMLPSRAFLGKTAPRLRRSPFLSQCQEAVMTNSLKE